MKKYLIVLLTLLLSFYATAEDKKESAQTYEGTLATGMMAIGGETTGVVLKTKDGKEYELDLGKNAGISKLADTLNGKPVVVTGVLHVREGVEVKERHIIEVATLKAGAGK